MSHSIEIVVPESLQPLERGELYDLICDVFDKLDDGQIVGDGEQESQMGRFESA